MSSRKRNSDEKDENRHAVKYEFDVEDEVENDEIVCSKRHKSKLSILTLCIHLATLVVSITIYILNMSITVRINKTASMALYQFNGTLSIFYLQLFMGLFKMLDFSYDIVDFVYKSYERMKKNSYSNWRLCRSVSSRNLFLNLPSEVFVFIFVRSFNFNDIFMVVSR